MPLPAGVGVGWVRHQGVGGRGSTPRGEGGGGEAGTHSTVSSPGPSQSSRGAGKWAPSPRLPLLLLSL